MDNLKIFRVLFQSSPHTHTRKCPHTHVLTRVHTQVHTHFHMQTYTCAHMHVRVRQLQENILLSEPPPGWRSFLKAHKIYQCLQHQPYRPHTSHLKRLKMFNCRICLLQIFQTGKDFKLHSVRSQQGPCQYLYLNLNIFY